MEFPALIPVGYALFFLRGCDNAMMLLPVTFYFLHYVYRSLIFPFLLKGKSQMP